MGLIDKAKAFYADMRRDVPASYKSIDTEEPFDKIFTKPMGYLFTRFFIHIKPQCSVNSIPKTKVRNLDIDFIEPRGEMPCDERSARKTKKEYPELRNWRIEIVILFKPTSCSAKNNPPIVSMQSPADVCAEMCPRARLKKEALPFRFG